MIERHYADVEGGQVHYRRAGTGMPMIVLHASPMSSVAMKPWIEALSAHVTVYAPDTAGYGQSTPLEMPAGAEPGVDDYARRVLAFADAVGLDRFLLAGTHTGSKIALSVAVQAPERVAQLVMDGLGLYTVDEMAEQLACYTPPIEPVWHGGHLVETWHRLRSMWTFWPWYRQEAGRRLDESIPPLPVLQEMAFDMLRATPDWGLSYRAAFRYDARAALAHLRTPAVLLAKEADPLHEHLDRLRVQAPTLQVRSVGNTAHLAAVVDAVDLAAGLPPAPDSPAPVHRGGTSRRYLRTSQGRTHLRLDGDPQSPPLLLVHNSPGSADSCAPLIAELARDHLVIAPDTAGNGYSDPPAAAQPRIADFAGIHAEVLDALGYGPVQVYGSHTGACIGLELAVSRPDLVRGLVADGLPAFDDELVADLRKNYWIPMAPERNGEHLLRAWHTLRDVQLWWPWYRDDAAHRRPTGPSEPAELHRLVVEFIKSGETYRLSYQAAFDFDALPRLAGVKVPTLVCAAGADMLRAGSEQAAAGSPVVEFAELDETAGRGAAWAVRDQSVRLAD